MKTIYSKNIWMAAVPEWMVVITYRTAGDRNGVLSASGVALEDFNGETCKRPVWWDSEGKCWSRILSDTRMPRFDISEQLRKVAFDE